MRNVLPALRADVDGQRRLVRGLIIAGNLFDRVVHAEHFGSRPRPWTLRGYQTACLAAPALLLWANYAQVNRNTKAEHVRQAYIQELEEAPLPKRAVIIAPRKSAMVYRYVFHVEAGRLDVSVVNENRTRNWPRLIRYYRAQERPVFLHEAPRAALHGADLPDDPLPPGLRRWLARPDGRLGELGFRRIR
jgi:hypothetical protein